MTNRDGFFNDATDADVSGLLVKASRGDLAALRRLAQTAHRLKDRKLWLAALDHARSWAEDVEKRLGLARSHDYWKVHSDLYKHYYVGGEGEPKGRRSNPGQLQILENKGTDSEAEAAAHAIKRFHDVDMKRAPETWSVPGDDVGLVYLGHCPAVAFEHTECSGCKPQHLEVPDDDGNVDVLEWFGHRVMLGGDAIVAKRLDTREAVIVRGDLGKLRRFVDSSGLVGPAPCVEYVVKKIRASSKGGYHYVHRFGIAGAFNPTLVWDDSINGFVYQGGSYCADDWFHH